MKKYQQMRDTVKTSRYSMTELNMSFLANAMPWTFKKES